MAKFQICLIKFVLFIFQKIPEDLSLALGRALGLFWFHVIRYRRNLVLDNLEKAFRNEKSPGEIYDIARKNFIHYGVCLAEFLRLPAMKNEDLKKKIATRNLENIAGALEKGKGMIGLCGHYGNWDMLAISQALLGVNAHIITRHAKNRSIDGFWQKIREDRGVRFLPDRNSIFSILKLLKRNQVIGIVFDQHIGGNMGVRVKFFNRPASTMKAVALLSLKTGCSVVPIFAWRENGIHHMEVGSEIPFIKCENEEETIHKNTQNYNDVLEAFVRKHPEQWLWIHRRWK